MSSSPSSAHTNTGEQANWQFSGGSDPEKIVFENEKADEEKVEKGMMALLPSHSPRHFTFICRAIVTPTSRFFFPCRSSFLPLKKSKMVINSTSSLLVLLLLAIVLCSCSVDAYPPSFGDFLRRRLSEELAADELVAIPQIRRFDSAAWRHIGLGKRKRDLISSRVARNDGETISLLKNGRHLAVIGLGRK